MGECKKYYIFGNKKWSKQIFFVLSLVHISSLIKFPVSSSFPLINRTTFRVLNTKKEVLCFTFDSGVPVFWPQY